jgi:hypothetical protein
METWLELNGTKAGFLCWNITTLEPINSITWIQIGGHLTPSCTSSFFPFFLYHILFLVLRTLRSSWSYDASDEELNLIGWSTVFRFHQNFEIVNDQLNFFSFAILSMILIFLIWVVIG